MLRTAAALGWPLFVGVGASTTGSDGGRTGGGDGGGSGAGACLGAGAASGVGADTCSGPGAGNGSDSGLGACGALLRRAYCFGGPAGCEAAASPAGMDMS